MDLGFSFLVKKKLIRNFCLFCNLKIEHNKSELGIFIICPSFCGHYNLLLLVVAVRFSVGDDFWSGWLLFCFCSLCLLLNYYNTCIFIAK